MNKSILIIIVLFISSCSQAHDDNMSPGPVNPENTTARQSVTYYIDAQTGNDSNDGLSPEKAVRTMTACFSGGELPSMGCWKSAAMAKAENR